MSTPKRIEELEELTNLEGNELLMTEVPQSGQLASHMTMKISLNTLANYVNSRESGGSGAVIYDLSSEAIAQDYVYHHHIIFDDGTYEKQVNHDCMVFIWGRSLQSNAIRNSNDIWGGYTYVMLDDTVRLSPMLFLNGRAIFLKAGQKISLSSNYPIHNGYDGWINIIPIKSGGVFIDTSKDQSAYVYEEIIQHETQINVNYPSLIIGDFPMELADNYMPGTTTDSGFPEYFKTTVNGKNIIPSRKSFGTTGGGNMEINEMYVETGDKVVLKTPLYDNSPEEVVPDNSGIYGTYCMYPILMD